MKKYRGLWTRGNVLWMGYTDAVGVRQRVPTKYRVGQEEEAAAALEEVKKSVKAERELRAKLEADATASAVKPEQGGRLTLAALAHVWLQDRKKDEPGAAAANAWHLNYIVGELGAFKLADLEWHHVKRFLGTLKTMRKLKYAGGQYPTLSPRVQSGIYNTLNLLLQEAVRMKYIRANPCSGLRRGERPRRRDRDPEARKRNIYTRDEVDRLLSDESIPLYRRVIYAILLIAMVRPCEAFALHWRNWERLHEAGPLGKLDILRSFDTRTRQLTDTTKAAEAPREVPVHPELARILAEWKLRGWRELMGRAPTEDDPILVVPPDCDVEGAPRCNEFTLRRWFYDDLEALGMRRRVPYAMRRTAISLTEADSGKAHAVHILSHGQRQAVVYDLYVTLPWPELCQVILARKLNLHRSREAVPLRQAAADGAPPPSPPPGSGAQVPAISSSEQTECHSDCHSADPVLSKRPGSQGNSDGGNSGATLQRYVAPVGLTEPTCENRPALSLVGGSLASPAEPGCAGTVTVAEKSVTASLRDALDALESGGSADDLRRRLGELLKRL